MRRPRLVAALVALSLLVASSPAVHAAGRSVAKIDAVSTGGTWLGSFLDQALCLLGAKAYCGARVGAAKAPWSGKLGCRMDPNGRCLEEPQAVELGCGMDPDGRCTGPASGRKVADRGCTIDPNGKCSGSGGDSLDWGCTVDPNGQCIH
jgi:hypothetical protein